MGGRETVDLGTVGDRWGSYMTASTLNHSRQHGETVDPALAPLAVRSPSLAE